MASTKGMSEEEQNHLRSLFHAYDLDNSGRIEKNEFITICQELHVDSQEADTIFNRLDIDKDGTVTLEEFISGFNQRHQEKEDEGKPGDKESSENVEKFPNKKEKVISRYDIWVISFCLNIYLSI